MSAERADRTVAGGLTLQGRDGCADAVCMQTVVTQDRPDRRSHLLPEGKFLRRSAIASGAVYATLMAGMLLMMPALANTKSFWFLLVCVMASAVITYGAGIVVRRQSTDSAPRLTT